MRYFNVTLALLIFCVVVMIGCNPTIVPLQGNYSDKPFELTTTKPIDSVWSKLYNLFTSNGLPIKKIDRANGLVEVKRTDMISVYTFEDNAGHLEHPEAWIVLMKDFNNEKQWKPKIIYSQWSIHVKEIEKGKATIIIDPVVMCTYYPNSFTKVESPGRSTGKFEALLESYLKGEEVN